MQTTDHSAYLHVHSGLVPTCHCVCPSCASFCLDCWYRCRTRSSQLCRSSIVQRHSIDRIFAESGHRRHPSFTDLQLMWMMLTSEGRKCYASSTMIRLIQAISLLSTIGIVFALPNRWGNGQFPILDPLSNPKTDDPSKVNVTLNIMSRCSDSVSFLLQAKVI